jgi:diacylglycerol kinase (ATP)
MEKKFRREKVSNSILESFSNAVNGIFEAFYQEKNFKIHLFFALSIIFASLFVSFSSLEFIIILILIGLVFISEMFNTAIEILSDKVDSNEDDRIRLVKDISAGAVLISTLLSVIVGLIIFSKKFFSNTPLLIQKLSSLPEYIYISIFLFVLISSMVLKIWYMRLKGKKSNVQGGIISVHSSLAFSTFSFIVIHNWKDYVLIFMSFILAFLVVQSRLEAKIHTFSEVVNGAIFGIFVTIFLISIIRYLGGF